MWGFFYFLIFEDFSPAFHEEIQAKSKTANGILIETQCIN